MNQPRNVLNILLGSIVTLLFVSLFAFKETEKEKNLTREEAGTSAPNLWQAPDVPESITFAGESVPINRWDVKERFDRELLVNYFNQGTIIYLIKLANRNFPIISARLKANGVPDDFKYLCIAESNMQPLAVSRSGAVGYWQFMPKTAPGFGLEVSSSVDERRSLEESTDAACRYLKQAYSKFGNWTAAAASYNMGQGGYNSQATFQGTKNYYDLYLPEETNRYIFRILVFKYLLENAESLGFEVDDDEKFPVLNTRTVTVNSSISNLATFARQQGTTYKILRTMNPWIKGRSLTVPKGKSYKIELPVERTTAY